MVSKKHRPHHGLGPYKVEINSVYGEQTSAQQRLDFVLWYLANPPRGILTTSFDRIHFNDTGFREEFRDSHVTHPQSNQVNHFLSAVFLGYSSIPSDTALQCIIGHEKYGSVDSTAGNIVKNSLWDCSGGVNDDDLERFKTAILFDIAGDTTARDCELKKILPSPVEIPYANHATNPGLAAHPKDGRSMQDLRLSLKGYILGSFVQNGRIQSLTDEQMWLKRNLQYTVLLF